MEHKKQKVLIVEDEINTCNAIEAYFSQRGFATTTAATYDKAVALGLMNNPDLLISDWMLAENGDGLEVAKKLKFHNEAIKVVLFTAYDINLLKAKAKDISFTILEKPVSLARLHQVVKQLMSGN